MEVSMKKLPKFPIFLLLILFCCVQHRFVFGQCQFNGLEYQEYSYWVHSCNNCTCINSVPFCEKIQCKYEPCESGQVLMLSDEKCCPTCQNPKKSCNYDGYLINHNTEFSPKICTTCKCKNSQMECTENCQDQNEISQEAFKDLQQSIEQRRELFRQQRVLMSRPANQALIPEKSTSSICLYDNKIYEFNSTWSPLKCTQCTCSYNSVVDCYVHECPKLNCPNGIETDPDGCCPKCKLKETCAQNGVTYQDGDFWTSKTDSCLHCACTQGQVNCFEQNCSSTACQKGEMWVTKSDQCCAQCVSKMSENCEYHGKLHYNGEMWYTKGCQHCACVSGRVVCMNVECESKFCLKDEIMVRKKDDCCVTCRKPKVCSINNIVQIKENEFWLSNSVDLHQKKSPNPCKLCQCNDGRVECYTKSCQNDKYPTFAHLSVYLNEKKQINARTIPFLTDFIKSMRKNTLIFVSSGPKYSNLFLNDKMVKQFRLSDIAASKIYYKMDSTFDQDGYLNDHAVLSVMSHDNRTVHNILLEFELFRSNDETEYDLFKLRKDESFLPRSLKHLNQDRSVREHNTNNRNQKPRKTIFIQPGEAIKITSNELKPKSLPSSTNAQKLVYFLVSSKPKYGDLKLKKVYAADEIVPAGWTKVNDLYLEKSVREFTQTDLDKGNVWYEPFNEFPSCGTFGFDDQCSNELNPKYDHCMFEVYHQDKLGHLISKEIIHFSIQNEVINETVLGLEVIENQINPLTFSNFDIAGIDSSREYLMYRIIKSLGKDQGQLEHANHPGIPIATFTQKDLNKGLILYHSPKEIGANPKEFFFTFVVTNDNRSDTFPETPFHVKIVPANDQGPVFAESVSQVKLLQSASLILSRDLFDVQDPDTSLESLIFKIEKAPDNTVIELRNKGQRYVISKGDSFSVQEVRDGTFRLIHNGANINNDLFKISVSDGKHMAIKTINIDIKLIDSVAPRISERSTMLLTVKESQAKSIRRENMAFVDDHSSPEKIFYKLNSHSKLAGRLFNKDKLIEVNSMFTQADIDLQNMRYESPQEIGQSILTEVLSLDVADKEGNVQKDQMFTIKVEPVDNQAPTVQVLQDLNVEEAGYVILNESYIQVRDVDSGKDQLNVVIDSQPNFGFLESIHKGTKLSSFPLVDLIDGFSIRYVQSDHKNKEPTMDSFMFHVSDGINESPTHKIAINIKIINDEKPVAVFEPLQVQDGKRTILTNSSFFIVDFDSTPENIRIEVEKFPKYGKLYRSNQALNEINRDFSYSDILKNQISYLLEDQGSTKDEITFKISDESFSVVYDYLIKVIHTEKPGLVVEKNDGLDAIQGHIFPITSDMLYTVSKSKLNDKIVDYLLPDLVIYKVLGTPEFGRIQLRFDTFYQDILGPYSFMNTFTQNDINEGRVFYNHEANEPTGVTSFGFNVTDSSGNTLPDQRFTIAVRGDKLPPAIIQNRGLKVNQGQMALLSRYEFDVRDDDTSLDNIKFLIVTQPKLGRLEHKREPGRRIEFFFYQDLAYKNIHYVHEDVYNGLKNDLVDLRITDGKNDVSASVYVTITRVDNQMPLLKSKFVLNAKQLERTEISPSEIQVFDRDTPNDALKIIITHPPQYGTLERLVTGPSETKIEDKMISLNTNLNQKLNFILKFNNNQSDRKYVSVNEFTMSEIEKGRIFYRHLSQGVRQDRFGFIVYDGYNNMFMIDGGIQVSTYQIFYINIEAERNQAPVVQKNLGLNYLHQFETYTGRVIMKSELLITDKDNSDSDIIVEITRKPLHGFVQHKDRPGLAINRFTQHDLNHNKIYYILNNFDDQVTEDFFEFDVYDMAKNYVKQNRFDVRWSVVGFKEDEISVMETDGKVRVHIEKSGSLKQFSMVTCKTVSDTATSNRDSKFFDFVHTNVRIEFGEDESYKACDVIVNRDEDVEPIESFYVVLEDAKYAILGLRKRVKVNILDKEKESVLEFEKAGFEVQESDKFVSVAIVRNGDLTRDVQVECLTEDDSAIAGQDYVAKSSGNYVRIPAGQLYGFCDIEIIDDHLKEMQTEFFKVYLRNPSDGSKIGAKSESSVAIIGPNDVLADECKTKYQSVTEPNSKVYVEIAREKINIAEAFSVLVQSLPTDEHYIKNYFNTNGQISGKNLSIAESGLDYEPINEFVKFLPGEISKKIPVQIFKIPRNSPKIFTIQIRTVTSNTNKISSCEYIDPDFVNIVLGTYDKTDSLVGFNQSSLAINETSKIANVPIIRTGDFSKSFSLICSTKQQTATEGHDYVGRDSFEQSRVYFQPGEKEKMCSVEIINDDVFEADETFQIKLSDLRGPADLQLSSMTTMTVTILNDEDSCVISLSEEVYYTEEPSTSDSSVVKSVPILRSGDLTRTSYVRVGTSDGTARAGLDYKPKTEVLKFAPGVSVLDFEVEILHDYEREGHESFRVILGPQDPVSGIFGKIKTATVVIKDSVTNNQSDIVENSPIYLNSLVYHVLHKAGKKSVPAGEPLICLEPCDLNNPKYSSNSKLCQMIDRKKLRTAYSWEISTPNEYGEYSQFIKLAQNSFFSQTNESILEPIYFQAKFRIRCVIEYTRDNSRTIKSNFVQVVESSQVLDELKLSSRQRCEEKWSHLSKQTINLNSSIPSNFYSKSADSSLPLLNLKFDTPFIAKADYISADFIKNNPDLVDHLNYVRLSIEVPYTDGIVPLVSTMPILNIRHLINDEFHFYPNHICSNFIKLSSQDSHLKFGFVDQIEINSDRNQWIEISQKINTYRNNKTLKFYSNLDRDKCVWKITGFYDLTELTSYCQAQIVSSDLSDNSKSYLSIRIPLYVSYLYQSYQATWSSVDYKTNVEAAIKYKTKELYDHLVDDEVSNREGSRDLNFEMDKSLMSLSVSKISMTENGRLIIEFSTVPSFHGQFIKQRQDGLQSLILPPADLSTKFNLELVWSQYTYDYPEQTWKATSTDILNNFSGNYTIHLIPCYAKPNQSFKYPYECEPGEPLSYTIPISVEQSSMPVPSKYSLGTRLTLSNNLISSINPSINNQQFDGEFRQGDTVYGSVIWDGDEDRKSVYSLELERVFICSSDPSSVPVYDPDGTVYNKGPMFGCSQPHKSLKHRILLLDKNLPSESPRFEAQFLNEFLNTSNSTRLNTEKLKKNLVIDGFKFNVNFMFKIDNITKKLDQSPSVWYIQTIFYIRAGNAKRTRHVNIHSLRNVFNNGTNMNIIKLKADKRTSLLTSKIKASVNREKSGSPGLIKVIIPIILLLVIAILVIGSLVYYKKERFILLFNTESGNNDKNGIINLARKKFRKNLSEKELKESTSSSTNETMVVASPLLETTKDKKFEDGNLTFQTVVSKSSNYVTPGQIDEDDEYARKMSGDHKSGSSIKYLLDRVFGSRKEHKILKSLSTTSEYDDLSKNFLDQPNDEVPQFPKYPTIKRNNYLYFNYNNNRMNYFSSENVEVDVEKSELSNKFANGALTETMVAVSSMSGASPTQTTPVNSTTKCALPTIKRLSGTEV